MKTSLFPDTVTIYNRYKVSGKEHYKRCVVDGCYWLRETLRSVDNTNTAHVASTVSVLILAHKDYQCPNDWAENRQGFTLQEKDVLVLGECDKELGESLTVSGLRHLWGELAVEIQGVEVFDKAFMRNKHYEVVGV